MVKFLFTAGDHLAIVIFILSFYILSVVLEQLVDLIDLSIELLIDGLGKIFEVLPQTGQFLVMPVGNLSERVCLDLEIFLTKLTILLMVSAVQFYSFHCNLLPEVRLQNNFDFFVAFLHHLNEFLVVFLQVFYDFLLILSRRHDQAVLNLIEIVAQSLQAFP